MFLQNRKVMRWFCHLLILFLCHIITVNISLACYSAPLLILLQFEVVGSNFVNIFAYSIRIIFELNQIVQFRTALKRLNGILNEIYIVIIRLRDYHCRYWNNLQCRYASLCLLHLFIFALHILPHVKKVVITKHCCVVAICKYIHTECDCLKFQII